MIGTRFSRLVVLRKVDAPGRSRYVCTCDCGREVRVWATSLKTRNTKSCGCLKIDSAKSRATKHGKYGTRIYNIWAGMLGRCKNPSQDNYRWYGGRGISVCKRWHAFSNFYSDMGDPPSNKHELDRLDPNQGYSPSNCRWATALEQRRNTRRKIMVLLDGKKVSLHEACDRYGIRSGTTEKNRVLARIRLGWDPLKALTVPCLLGGERHEAELEKVRGRKSTQKPKPTSAEPGI